MYSCQEEYDAAMSAQAEAEDEYSAAIEFELYMCELLDKKQFDLFALEITCQHLHSKRFKDSGLSAVEYLTLLKTDLINPPKPESKPIEKPDDLPF